MKEIIQTYSMFRVCSVVEHVIDFQQASLAKDNLSDKHTASPVICDGAGGVQEIDKLHAGVQLHAVGYLIVNIPCFELVFVLGCSLNIFFLLSLFGIFFIQLGL